jgi:hypothetical protein
MNRCIEVTLKSQIQGIRAIIVFNPELLDFRLIAVKDVLAKLAFGKRERDMLDFSIDRAINRVFLDC